MKKKIVNKIQSREMVRDIKGSREISEAWMQGGKAIGEVVKPKKKK